MNYEKMLQIASNVGVRENVQLVQYLLTSLVKIFHFIVTAEGKFKRIHYTKNYAFLRSTAKKRPVCSVSLRWVNVKREESKFHDAAAQSWEVKIMLQQSPENMTVKVNQ